MTIPIWVLLGFAAWTFAILVLGIGTDRLSKIWAGRAGFADFPGDQPHGGARYRRIVRAHANCVENLPLYGAVALAIVVSGASGWWLDALATTFMVARVFQTLIHIVPAETNRSVAWRFSFFCVQLACLAAMTVNVARVAI